ncbi:MAG TPA: type 4a pilus biogenesis protein PilO [Candidatus Paceibacterota bacterium]|nr:type 4a pilus biogenesis protein PilO [Candidatus Paceibacterota bacterium]
MKTIISIILLLGSVGLFFAYTNPKYQEVKVAKVELAELDKALKQSKDILAKRGQLQQKYNSFKEADRQALESLLPDHVDNIKLILDMNNIAATHNLSLKGIKIDEEKKDTSGNQITSKTPYGSILVSFRVTSSYENFVKFLRDLERSLRIVDVAALSFKATDSGTYDFDVTIKTYWLNK